MDLWLVLSSFLMVIIMRVISLLFREVDNIGIILKNNKPEKFFSHEAIALVSL